VGRGCGLGSGGFRPSTIASVGKVVFVFSHHRLLPCGGGRWVFGGRWSVLFFFATFFRFIYVCLLVCFLFLFLYVLCSQRSVVTFGFENPKGSGSFSPKKILIFSNVLDSSLDLGSITSVLGSNVLDSSLDLSLTRSVLGYGCVGILVLFVSLFVPGLLRSAGLRGSVLPPLFCSKELLSLLLVQGVVGTWVWFRVGG
jgi:hypothetical protein